MKRIARRLSFTLLVTFMLTAIVADDYDFQDGEELFDTEISISNYNRSEQVTMEILRRRGPQTYDAVWENVLFYRRADRIYWSPERIAERLKSPRLPQEEFEALIEKFHEGTTEGEFWRRETATEGTVPYKMRQNAIARLQKLVDRVESGEIKPLNEQIEIQNRGYKEPAVTDSYVPGRLQYIAMLKERMENNERQQVMESQTLAQNIAANENSAEKLEKSIASIENEKAQVVARREAVEKEHKKVAPEIYSGYTIMREVKPTRNFRRAVSPLHLPEEYDFLKRGRSSRNGAGNNSGTNNSGSSLSEEEQSKKRQLEQKLNDSKNREAGIDDALRQKAKEQKEAEERARKARIKQEELLKQAKKDKEMLDDATELEEQEKARLAQQQAEQKRQADAEKRRRDEAERKRAEKQQKEKTDKRNKELEEGKAPAQNDNSPAKNNPQEQNRQTPPNDFVPPKRKEEDDEEEKESPDDKRKRRKEERDRRKAERDKNFAEGKGNFSDEQLARQQQRQEKREAFEAEYDERNANFDLQVRAFWGGVEEKAGRRKHERQLARYMDRDDRQFYRAANRERRRHEREMKKMRHVSTGETYIPPDVLYGTDRYKKIERRAGFGLRIDRGNKIKQRILRSGKHEQWSDKEIATMFDGDVAQLEKNIDSLKAMRRPLAALKEFEKLQLTINSSWQQLKDDNTLKKTVIRSFKMCLEQYIGTDILSMNKDNAVEKHLERLHDGLDDAGPTLAIEYFLKTTFDKVDNKVLGKTIKEIAGDLASDAWFAGEVGRENGKFIVEIVLLTSELKDQQMVVDKNKAVTYDKRKLAEIDDSIRKMEMLKQFYQEGDAMKLLKKRNDVYIESVFNRRAKSDDQVYTNSFNYGITRKDPCYPDNDRSLILDSFWANESHAGEGFQTFDYEKAKKWVSMSSQKALGIYKKQKKYGENPKYENDKLGGFFVELNNINNN